MPDDLEIYCTTKFDKDIIVGDRHCLNYIKRPSAGNEDVTFTIHIPCKQLKDFHDKKINILSGYSYVQILNAFIGKKYPIKIKENCLRIEERLRRVFSEVARQFVAKTGRAWQDLITKVKSVAIRQGELVTAALVSNLECQVGQLEHDTGHILGENKILEVTCKEVSETLGKIKTKLDNTEADLALIGAYNRWS